jgi:hypothetical protein
MAAIKRAGNRIITKVVNGQRRVSCSCCPSEEGCCMYPAADVESGLITSEDLPDQIEVTYPVAFDGSRIFNKTGLEYNFEAENARVFVDDFFVSGNYAWRFQIGIGGNIDIDAFLNVDNPKCLIRVPEVDGLDGASDLFADTYTVYVNGLADVFDETFLVIRRSLCVWSSDVDEGEPSGVVLTAPQSFSPKWVLEVADVGQAKDDPQNSPIGLYGNQGTEISE